MQNLMIITIIHPKMSVALSESTVCEKVKVSMSTVFKKI